MSLRKAVLASRQASVARRARRRPYRKRLFSAAHVSGRLLDASDKNLPFTRTYPVVPAQTTLDQRSAGPLNCE
jgi:hypothetical protein